MLRETYRREYRPRSGIAHGGIGAGSVELRKDGNFVNWRIANNWPVGPGAPWNAMAQPLPGIGIDREAAFLFFVLRVKRSGHPPFLKLLKITNDMAPAGLSQYDPAFIFPWMTAIEEVHYSARFPFAWLDFNDRDVPLKLRMEVVSPFVPHDVDASSLPGVYFNFAIESHDDQPVEVTLIGTLRNLVGYDVFEKCFTSRLIEPGAFCCFEHGCEGLDTAHDSYGTMGLASLSPETSYYLGWGHLHPYYEQLLRHRDLPNIDDTDGKQAWLAKHPEDRARLSWLPDTEGRNEYREELDKKVAGYRKGEEQAIYSSLARGATLAPGERLEHTFVLAWHFPNRYRAAREDFDRVSVEDPRERVGHYYGTRFADSVEVAQHLIANRADLLASTNAFVDNFYASDAPEVVLDQINSNLNTLVTNTYLDEQRRWGIMDDGGLIGRKPGSVWGLNPDVSIYASVMTASLFPELQTSALQGMAARQQSDGMIGCGRSDWPGNLILMMLRQFCWSNDQTVLTMFWPTIKRSFDFALRELDKDGDGIPDISGHTNHCSYDNLPMYGLSAYVGSQWLSTLVHLRDAARAMDDAALEAKVAALLPNARRSFNERLWNGTYYRLFDDPREAHPEEGCMTDQLLGQWVAHLDGLGYVVETERVRASLREILRRNRRPGFLCNCTWEDQLDPETGLTPVPPNVWNDQANTPWEGGELAFASFLLYEGMVDEAFEVIANVDRLYREAQLYFDHQEAFGHYMRGMSAWGILNGLLGLQINQGVYTFAPKVKMDAFTLYFAAPSFTAHYVQDGDKITIRVLTGEFRPRRIVLPTGEHTYEGGFCVPAGEELVVFSQ